jgi:hypothetical protein
MLANLLKGRALVLAALSALLCANSHAQTTVPYQEVHTVADTAHAVPVEHSVTISTAGTYQVTLVDLGAALTPTAPLASVKLAITQGSSIVGTPLSGAGSVQFTATAGATYVLHVVGAPGTVAGSGPIGIQVTAVTDNTVVDTFSDTLALPSAALPSNEAVIDDTFTVASSGSYVVTLTDMQLPQALTTLTLIITTTNGTIVTNPPLPAAGSATIALQQGVSYRIFAVGQSDPTIDAGLYSAVVTPAGGGAPVYGKAVPVGVVSPAQNATPTAGLGYTLSLVDLGVPAALTAAGAVVTLDGQVVTTLTAAGSSPPFTAAAGTYQVFVLASTATAGSYALALAPQNGAAALNVARGVTAPGSKVSAYSFDAAVTSGGSYNFNLVDFGIPNPLTSVNAVAVQSGAVLGTPLKAAGTTGVTVASGTVSLLVFAQPPTTGGLFDVDLAASVGGAPVFETTQGVGQLFAARQITIPVSGSYAVNVSDLGFPAALSTFAVIATQGSNQLGLAYGGGAFSFTAPAPGTYFINFIAQPGGTDGAGTYALNVAAGPTVVLQASTTTVTSGATVNLNWSSNNATGCVASGGWSGTQPTTGTATSPVLTASTTFTLTCSGEGVSAKQSVAVTVTPATGSGGGGGGGGALKLDFLMTLLAVLVTRFVARRRLSPALV